MVSQLLLQKLTHQAPIHLNFLTIS